MTNTLDQRIENAIKACGSQVEAPRGFVSSKSAERKAMNVIARLDGALGRAAYVTLGGADGTEAAYVLENTPARKGLVLELSSEYAALARTKARHVHGMGKELNVLQGDLLQTYKQAAILLREWKKSRAIDSVVVTAHAVLHELSDRGSVKRKADLEALIAAFITLPMPVHFITREPCAPNGWPRTIYLEAACSAKNLCALAELIHQRHFPSNRPPLQLAKSVRMDPKLGVETIIKLLYIDDLPYEIDEKVTSFTGSDLVETIMMVLGDPSGIASTASLQTDSFNRLCDEAGIKAFEGGMKPLQLPELHKLVHARNSYAREQSRPMAEVETTSDASQDLDGYKSITETLGTIQLQNYRTRNWQESLQSLSGVLLDMVERAAAVQQRDPHLIVNDVIYATRAALKTNIPDRFELGYKQLEEVRVTWVGVYPPVDVVQGIDGWFSISCESIRAGAHIVFFQPEPSYVDHFRQ